MVPGVAGALRLDVVIHDRGSMLNRLCHLIPALICLLASGGLAFAHPHVWVTMKSELAYAPDGSATGVRHAWTFDEMFSVFATQGLETKQKGVFTREDLAPLAEVNVTSLKEYDFFTYAKVNGKKVGFNEPIDYWLEFTDGALTLHFTLPFKAPVRAQSIDLEIYDPTWFVDFAFADKEPFRLVGAPPSCKASIGRPNGNTASNNLGEQFFNSLDPSSNYGSRFANKVWVKCT